MPRWRAGSRIGESHAGNIGSIGSGRSVQEHLITKITIAVVHSADGSVGIRIISASGAVRSEEIPGGGRGVEKTGSELKFDRRRTDGKRLTAG